MRKSRDPNDYPDLLIIRHGQTQWNAAGLMQGQMDSPLTQKGREQAEHLRGLLGQAGLTAAHRAWVSPLGRAQQTAAICLRGHFDTPTTDTRLAEIGVGELEGMSFEDASTAFPHLADHPGPIGWQFFAPGGESYAEFSGRIQSWLDELSSPAVVVTHGITSRVMRALVLGLGFDALNELPGGQGIIHRIRGGVAEILE